MQNGIDLNEIVNAFILNYHQTNNTDGNIDMFIDRVVGGGSNLVEIKAYELGTMIIRMIEEGDAKEKIVKYVASSISIPTGGIISYLLAMFN